jgi:hypothetical protein
MGSSRRALFQSSAARLQRTEVGIDRRQSSLGIASRRWHGGSEVGAEEALAKLNVFDCACLGTGHVMAVTDSRPDGPPWSAPPCVSHPAIITVFHCYLGKHLLMFL